jgi:hypothetical protein
MNQDKNTGFSAKHDDNRLDQTIAGAVKKSAKDGRLSCSAAFEIVENNNTDAAHVGKTVDLLDFRLEKCQLGLFGYPSKKKIVKAVTVVDPLLSEAIKDALVDDRLSCESAWVIAKRLGVAKMDVSNTCEALGIKIKPCQLGAF